MKEPVRDGLLEYLGELLHQSEHTYDWILKDRLIEKINACHVLLDIAGKYDTWYEKTAAELRKIKQH